MQASDTAVCRRWRRRVAASLALTLLAAGCRGGNSATKQRSGVAPTGRIGSTIAAQIKAKLPGAPSVNSLTLQCAKGVKIQRGNNFTCNLLTEHGKAFAGTVLVTVTNSSGTSYRYNGEFNGKPVSGTVSVS